MDGKMENRFPGGAKVLVVDDDPGFLKMIRMMLQSCNYKATTCSSPSSSLSILRERISEYDFLLTEIHMSEMNGFDLLDIVRVEFGLPVILMSIDTQMEVMKKGSSKGACFFLMKPVDITHVRKMWQYVVPKKRKDVDILNGDIMAKETSYNINSMTSENRDETIKRAKGKCVMIIDGESERGSNKAKQVMKKKGKDKHKIAYSRKEKIIWANDLEQKFVDTINLLGEAALPSKIVRLMNVEGLTRYQVASHLQKHRLRKTNKSSKRRTITPLPPICNYQFSSSWPQPQFDPFPNQFMFSSQSSCLSNQAGSLPQVTPWSLSPVMPSIPSTYQMVTLSHVEDCLKNLGLNANTNVETHQAAPSSETPAQINQNSIPNDAFNEFQVLLEADIEIADIENDFGIFDELDDFTVSPPFNETTDVIVEGLDGMDLVQSDLWGDENSMMPEFALMSLEGFSSTDPRKQNSCAKAAAESSAKAIDDVEDFGELVERFVNAMHRDDPLARILNDDLRLRFAGP